MTDTPDPALLLANNISDRSNHASPEEWMIARNAALAAIRETTELAARMIEENQIRHSDEGPSLSPRWEGNQDALAYATSLRANRHLEKGSTDDHYPDC